MIWNRFSCSIISGLLPIILFGQNYNQINGVSIESPPTPFKAHVYQEVKDIDATWVAIIPYGYSKENEPHVYFDSDGQWWGERPSGIEEMIKMAQQKNLKIMLKPQVWMHNSWVGQFKLEDETSWQTWEESYRSYIMTFVGIAEKYGVELFCIGTEYRYAAEMRPEFWSLLISDIRLIYKGDLTYAANWDEYGKIDFWHELDYIGINAYFPLTNSLTPNILELDLAWRPIKSKLNTLSDRFRKPILFTEYGYRSIEGSTGNQWELDGNLANLEIQSNAYLAFYRSFWNSQYVVGGFLWKWHMNESQKKSNLPNYTPQGKPVLQIIEMYY